MPYTENLNVSQKKVIELIVKNLQKRGVTNKFMQGFSLKFPKRQYSNWYRN